MKTVSGKLEKELTEVAEDMGVSKEAALREAVAFYKRHRHTSSLQNELLLWDRASAEDFAVFEKQI